MKRRLHILILLIVTVAVFLTGTGVTIINYCCSGCAGQTLFITKAHTCCEQEESNAESEQQPCCSSHQHDVPYNTSAGSDTNAGHCKVSRLTADIDAFSFRSQVIVPFVWISGASPVLSLPAVSKISDQSDSYTEYESSPHSPREYLSLIRVLII